MALSLILSSHCLNSAAELEGMPSNALVSFHCTLVTCDILNSVDVSLRHVFNIDTFSYHLFARAPLSSVILQLVSQRPAIP